MQAPGYKEAWTEGVDGGGTAPVAPQTVSQDQAAYLDAWMDNEAGPLEKAVKAAGVNPLAALKKPAQDEEKQ